MTKRIIVRPRASQDLDEHFAYIAENNLEAALRFFVQRDRRSLNLPEAQELVVLISLRILACRDYENGQ